MDNHSFTKVGDNSLCFVRRLLVFGTVTGSAVYALNW